MATTRNLSNLIVFRNSQGLQARGSLLKLSRTTLIFEVYNPYSIVQLSEVLDDMEIRSGERVVYNGRAVVTNLVNTGLMLIVSARLVDAWSDLRGLIGDSRRIELEVETFIEDWQESHRIRPDYQIAVSQLRSFLTELNRWLEHVDIQGDPNEIRPSTDDDLELLDTLGRRLLPRLGEMFLQFEQAAAEVPGEERTTHARYVQRDLHPLLMRAPFVHRAYHKPLGYAGDYEMVNMMLRGPHEGPTIYSRLVNALHLQTGPAVAHSKRIDILEDWLTQSAQAAERGDKALRILNVGCGPAIELQRFIRNCPASERCQLRLMDFNKQTLEYTEGKLGEAVAASGNHPAIEYVHESVHNLLKQASKARAERIEQYYDLVYCAGLFDYLSDKICSRLLTLFYEWTVPGGRIMATNVHPRNTALYLMEHILEWYLIYRDEEQMARLVPTEWSRRVFVDSTGINVFLDLDKSLTSNG